MVLRQDTETFLRVIENAVRHFGGVPRLLNFDNLKAAVIKADWNDPAMNPKLADFCRHYGMTPMPCRSYTPQYKGKVERGVGYANPHFPHFHALRSGSMALSGASRQKQISSSSSKPAAMRQT